MASESSFHLRREGIYVDGSYNSIEWKTLEDAASFHVKVVKKTEGVKIITIKKTKLKMDGHRAIRILIHYNCFNIGMVDNIFFTFSKDKNMRYTIALTTYVSDYAKNIIIFEKFVKSWRKKQPYLINENGSGEMLRQ